MVVSVQSSVHRYLLIASGLLGWCTEDRPRVTECLRSRSDTCHLLSVRWVPRTRRVVRRRANMNTMNRCYPHLHPFKPDTSLSIGHWQTDVANGATQMLQYNVVKNFGQVSLLADTPMWIPARSTLPAKDLKGFRRNAVSPIVAAGQLERRSRPRTAEPIATGFDDQPPRSPSTHSLTVRKKRVVVKL